MNTTLIIMAAGIGSRFGEGIKQLAQMGPNGEIIMDYSIHDAKEAGFNKVVFIIRKDIFKEFEEIIGNRIKEQIDVEYVFQELDDLPEGFEVPEGRTKPWGTGQAVLCCKDVVKEPFVIINADDYYGKKAFVKLHDFLVSGDCCATSSAFRGPSAATCASAARTCSACPMPRPGASAAAWACFSRTVPCWAP